MMSPNFVLLVRLIILTWFVQDMGTVILSGNGTEAGQVITTTIGGRNGQPKQVTE